MAVDNGYHFAAQTLPTHADLPYDSPSMDVSIQSSTRGSSSPASGHSHMPFPPSEDSYLPEQQASTNNGNIDKTAAQESRKLTPNNLGISLVAQIHSLRKELGSKDSMIENLEESLHRSRVENEQSTKDLRIQKLEVTSLQKQMQSLEKDMLQALEEIAKDRDNAIETTTDTRKRLEDSSRKVRAQREEANKTHALWEKDRQTWDDKRRRLESRVHTVEERLKTMVAEMLNVKCTDQNISGIGDDVDEGMKDSWFDNCSDPHDISATSHLSNRSLDQSYDITKTSNIRSSWMNGLHSLGGSQMSGLSLAEELEFEQGENAAEKEDNGKNSQSEDAYTLAGRFPLDEKVRRDFQAYAQEEPLGDETSGQHSIGIINDYIDFPGKTLGNHYMDTGTQLSSPPSPSLHQQEPRVSEKGTEQTEPTANQSRKRINIPQIFIEQTRALKTPQPMTSSMISTGSQTVGQPEDSASTGKAANNTTVSAPFSATEMKSACTQTLEDPIPVSKSASSRLSPSSTDVPVIAIHPPASRPSSSRKSVMLPPRTKNAACQVIIELPRPMKSTSMQTEETRADKRPFKIPPRSPSSKLPVQAPPQLAERRKLAGTVSGPESSAHSLPSHARVRAEGKHHSARTARIRNACSGHNDDGPLNHNQRSGPRRPIRSGSILAGFDVSSDDESKNTEDHFSDDEFLNAAPVRKTLSKVQNSWKLVPHLKDSVLERLESASEEAENEKRVSVPKPATAKAKAQSRTTSKTFHIRPVETYRNALSNVKQPDIRRKALVSNGVLKHGQRSSIPSESNVLSNEATVAPPFPVPTRLSSRKVPPNVRDRAASPSPRTTTFFGARKGQNSDRSHTKRKILRKVQSAAAVTQPEVPLRLASLQSLSISSTVPPSPKSTAPRRSQVLPYSSVPELPSHSTLPQSRAGETSVDAPREQSSVVDAIAQTMVGEWMWKYVRKRTSFGITESAQGEFDLGRNGDNGNGSGVRHKRWVWLAPFERAVIWSSKQPTSGPALLGKGGRKLTIQSVLDVKDDTPLPKNAGSQTIFDRSILILTPQRALKFTAISRERHYIWLSALSYLSHSTRGMDDLASLPPLPEQGCQYLHSHDPVTGFRRTQFQESVRTAKSKARPSIGVHSYSSPIGLIEQEATEGARLPWEERGAESDDAAEPPQVRRVAAHARNRSTTGSRPGPLNAFYTYPNNAMAVASCCSLQGPTSREKYDRYTPQLQVGSGINLTTSTLMRGITESSNAPSPVVPDNFFDSAATIRMEAFIEGREKECVLATRGRSYGARQGRKDMNFWGLDASAARSGMANAKIKGEDPFTGF